MGTALHLAWPFFDAKMLRTGGLGALDLTLAPSANVFKLPDMTAWAVFIKVHSREKNYPFTYRGENGVLHTLFFKNFFNFFFAEAIDFETFCCAMPSNDAISAAVTPFMQ